ncbi:unnamed protein product, partial [Phaeothamnion confervicola]
VNALVIGGNLTLNGKSANLAQYDTGSHTWYSRFEPQLYLYGAAAGEVYDLVVQPDPTNAPFDDLYVVGAFDTICKTCQQQYCSVGLWTGDSFDKVGDGLCPRAVDVTMKIMAAALTASGDVFVGGTFQSRVWSGEKFVNIYNVAIQAAKDAWLPLQEPTGGGLGCNWCIVSVMSLAWNERDKRLYIGGKFNMVDSFYIEPGLAVWDAAGGIRGFPGGGLAYDTPPEDESGTVYDGVATSLIYDDETRSLYVAGTFERVGGMRCDSIAVWREDSAAWTCLYEPHHSFSLITSLEYTKQMLYVAGLPSNVSSWPGNRVAGGNGGADGGDGGDSNRSAPATGYTIARMSQSPALFSGKYDYWGDGGNGGGGG